MKSIKGTKCFFCEDCGWEVLVVTKGYIPECCEKEMKRGGAPKAVKMLNPIKNSKRMGR